MKQEGRISPPLSACLLAFLPVVTVKNAVGVTRGHGQGVMGQAVKHFCFNPDALAADKTAGVEVGQEFRALGASVHAGVLGVLAARLGAGQVFERHDSSFPLVARPFGLPLSNNYKIQEKERRYNDVPIIPQNPHIPHYIALPIL